MFGVKLVECGDVLQTRVGPGQGDRSLGLSGALDSPAWLNESLTHCELRIGFPGDDAVKTGECPIKGHVPRALPRYGMSRVTTSHTSATKLTLARHRAVEELRWGEYADSRWGRRDGRRAATMKHTLLGLRLHARHRPCPRPGLMTEEECGD